VKKTTQLRQLLSSGKIVVAPGAFNALSAKIIEQAGFPAVYMTGYGASADLLGAPDYGLLTQTEMAYHAARLAQAVNVPLIADGDTGYGNAINVRRTIREYERAGVAAIHLEDQVMPKRCGHMEGKQVIVWSGASRWHDLLRHEDSLGLAWRSAWIGAKHCGIGNLQLVIPRLQRRTRAC